MKKHLSIKPTYHFHSYQDITPEWLENEKIKFILSDLDSTLSRHNQFHNEKEKQAFREWYEKIEQVGTGLIIVSNNTQEQVDKFTHEYKIVGFGKCQKPHIEKIEKNLIHKGLNIETSLFIGDQLFTDILCANRLGMRSGYITPIIDIERKEPLRIRVKRMFEKIIIKF